METKNESKEDITAKPDRNEVEGADTGCYVLESVLENIPDTITELFIEFQSGARQYNFDTIDALDNIASMCYFLDHIWFEPKHIHTADGTQYVLQHEDFDFKIQIDSGGRGDCYSHKCVLSKWEESLTDSGT